MVNPIRKAQTVVSDYVVDHLDKSDLKDGESPYELFDTYVVWFCYILGGWKALVSTTLIDGMYYEITYDKAKGKIYLDAYKKFENQEIEL